MARKRYDGDAPSMPLYQVVVLSIVQSLTEFLPISSTAHLALAPWLLGWRDPGLTFDIALHLGTLAATVLYFVRVWVQIVAQGFGFRAGEDPELRRNRRLLWLLAAGTLPVAVLGFLFEDYAETAWRSPFVIASLLIAVGVLMYFADRISTLKKDLGDISFLDAMIIGLSQAIAIVPGTSRSGITISASLARNINRPAAARFSFLLSMPALTGAAAKATWDLLRHGGIPPDMQAAFVLGIALSAVTGWLVIALFLRYLRTHTLRFFVYYRIVFGIIIFALAVFRRP